MENNTNLKARKFNRQYYPNIKRIRQEPRQKIRQLLRSFIPLNQPEPGHQHSSQS
ncbi:hypothetical protein [Mucilaginibacter panaciglaebae]|uniref:hypothetical protein n=1 Tax=Mucilaginibacter panaciglaebae TaxID=502331 RepID=UPI0031E7A3D6